MRLIRQAFSSVCDTIKLTSRIHDFYQVYCLTETVMDSFSMYSTFENQPFCHWTSCFIDAFLSLLHSQSLRLTRKCWSSTTSVDRRSDPDRFQIWPRLWVDWPDPTRIQKLRTQEWARFEIPRHDPSLLKKIRPHLHLTKYNIILNAVGLVRPPIIFINCTGRWRPCHWRAR